MLLEFRVNNYRSIKDTEVFSMISSEEVHSFQVNKYHLLQTAVLYGANASGKSNILRAFSFMKNYVLNTKKVMQSIDKLPYDPFLLNTETEDSSSLFEIIFIIDNIKYRYGFEADKNTVYSEWLFEDQTGKKEAKLFQRDRDDKIFYINPERFKEGSGLKAQENQLFIWKCDQEGGEISRKIFNWFLNLTYLNGIDFEKYITDTINELQNKNTRDDIIKLLKAADLGINSFSITEEELPKDYIAKISLSDNFKGIIENEPNREVVIVKTNTKHTQYDEANLPVEKEVTFNLYEHESLGTSKFFSLTAPILGAIKQGSLLIIDELDASLHPLLTKKLISLFHDKNINKNNAQLIFTTHDTNLLNTRFFSREQVWLIEKDSFSSTHSNSLLEFKGIRPTENFEKNYIMGKYGAIPYLGEFNFTEDNDG